MRHRAHAKRNDPCSQRRRLTRLAYRRRRGRRGGKACPTIELYVDDERHMVGHSDTSPAATMQRQSTGACKTQEALSGRGLVLLTWMLQLPVGPAGGSIRPKR